LALLVHPQFNPVAIQLGPVGIHWYGLMYLAGFLAFLWLGNRRVKRPPFAQQGWRSDDVDALLMAGVIGVILGGRLGYVLFYKPGYYLANPAEIIAIWRGGMSFHGGLLGVIAAMAWFARRKNGGRLTFNALANVGDFVAPLVPPGLMFGRLGNFINGELWGRPSDVPWAMVFPQAGDALPRHPSQLYEAGLEGLLLFLVLWFYARSSHAQQGVGRVAGLFLVGYGLARFAVEFAREPDRFLGTLSLGMSMGQWLSLPLILFGLWLLLRKASKA
jgi:phosphatidylglycerol:prolipoprotein diacylglycerol transferase